MDKQTSFKATFVKALTKLERIFESDVAQATAPEKEQPLSIKKRFTREIIDNGNAYILEKFINKYIRDSESKDLEYLLQNNIELAYWLVEEADEELLRKLPVKFREMVDRQLKSSEQ